MKSSRAYDAPHIPLLLSLFPRVFAWGSRGYIRSNTAIPDKLNTTVPKRASIKARMRKKRERNRVKVTEYLSEGALSLTAFSSLANEGGERGQMALLS